MSGSTPSRGAGIEAPVAPCLRLGRAHHFTDAALAYVRFAIEHPGHYQVMFNKSLLDVSDPELAAAEAAAGAELAWFFDAVAQ